MLKCSMRHITWLPSSNWKLNFKAKFREHFSVCSPSWHLLSLLYTYTGYVPNGQKLQITDLFSTYWKALKYILNPGTLLLDPVPEVTPLDICLTVSSCRVKSRG